KEREERMKKLRRRRNTIITLAVLALLILLALIFLLKLVLDRLNSSAAPSESSVQEIVIDENTSAAENWTQDEDSEEEGEDEPEETVDDRFELPSFVGSRFETANDEAADLGLYTNVQTTNDDHYETGVVMAQDPEDGTMVRPGDTITLYVSLGPVQTLSKVPDLFGMTKDEAQARLTEEGLVLGLVSEDYSNSVQEGKVIGQGTEEGTEVAKGTSIDITISKGPQETSEKTGASGTVTISQPFSKAEENGKLMVVAYDADGNASKIYENTVSYSTFSSLGGSIKVNYPAGTTKVEVYLNDNLIMSEEING
ncbi:MAG: PASTA domain-containing protein, partial [Firmicutes bacterium]|nr:PASTA domain-containing protein [Bacillota bacterium]